MTDELVKKFEKAATQAHGGHSWSMGRSPRIRYNEETGEEYWTEQGLAELRVSNAKLTAILEVVEYAPKILEHIRALESSLSTLRSAPTWNDGVRAAADYCKKVAAAIRSANNKGNKRQRQDAEAIAADYEKTATAILSLIKEG